jgi:translation initiation factor IF-2
VRAPRGREPRRGRAAGPHAGAGHARVGHATGAVSGGGGGGGGGAPGGPHPTPGAPPPPPRRAVARPPCPGRTHADRAGGREGRAERRAGGCAGTLGTAAQGEGRRRGREERGQKAHLGA